MMASLSGLTISHLCLSPALAPRGDERKFLPLLRHRFAESALLVAGWNVGR